MPRKKKTRTGVLPSRKQHKKNTPKHHGTQQYCVVWNKAWIPEQKWKYHTSENFFGKRSDQASIKSGLGVALINRDDAVNNHPKTENYKRDMKTLQKQNMKLYSMDKKSGSRLELKKIQIIEKRYSKKRRYYCRNSSISDSNSDCSLSSDRDR